MLFARALRTLLIALLAVVALAGTARADCTSPAGGTGRVIYASNYNTMVYCNGTNWISMAGGVSQTINTSGGASVAGSNTQIQYNNGGVLAASSGLTWNNTSSLLTATNISATALSVSNGIVAGPYVQLTSDTTVCAAGSAGRISYANNALTYCNGTAWSPFGGSSALGDRITSGTNAAIINSNTGITSLSTAGTTWGYLGSGASYLPTLSGGLVSYTNVSLTQGTVGNNLQFVSQTFTNLVGSGGNQIVSGTSNVTVTGGSTNSIGFVSNNATVMTVSNSRVGIGTTTPSAALLDIPAAYNGLRLGSVAPAGAWAAAVSYIPGSNVGIQFQATASGSGFVQIFNNYSGSFVGYIQTTDTATTYSTSSDRRLKENIVETAAGLAKLMQIGVRDFNFRADPSKTRVQGFIAQDLAKVYPEAVNTNGDDGKAPLVKGKPAWGVDYGRLTPLIVQSVQELKKQNDDLRALVAKQGAQIDALLKTNAAAAAKVGQQ